MQGFRRSSRRASRALLLCLAGTALLAACRSTRRAPDLRGIYNRAAGYHDEHTNPVIVVPGILGTKLVDPETGQVVWGAFGGGAANPKKPADARLLALPMRPGVRLAELRDEVEAREVLETFKVRMIGLPFHLKAYIDILLTLGAGGFRDESVRYPFEIDYGPGHFTCFQFPYDWRRDNVENARRLWEFILEKRAYVQAEHQRRYGAVDPDLKFDLITHSMGGLAVRYLLRFGPVDLPADGSLPEVTWEGARYVERAVMIAPPNAGALESLDYLVRGRKFGPLTPTYPPALLGTFPASYQMLPRGRHGVLFEAGSPERHLDPLDPEIWERYGWGLMAADQADVLSVLLPDVRDAPQRRAIARDHLRKSLQRAARFQAALDQPAVPPAGLELDLVAGDAEDTPAAMSVDPATGRLTVAAVAPGDGKVLRSSALMDERLQGEWTPGLRSPIGWSNVLFLFSNHLGITRDPAFADNMLFLLLEAPRRQGPVAWLRGDGSRHLRSRGFPGG